MAKKSKKEQVVKETAALAPRRPAEPLAIERNMDRALRLFDRMFDEFWRRPFLPSLWEPERWWPGRRQLPDLDVYEEKDEVVVKAELPGMTKDNIEVNLAGTILTIKGEKKAEEDVKERDYRYRERSHGMFLRRIELPSEVKADEITASFKDGVLEVHLPKTEEAKKKTISVKVE